MTKKNGVIDSLSVDCIIFGFTDSELSVLIVKHRDGISAGSWALPGNYINFDESIDIAAARILNAQTAVENIYLEQFRTFGETDRFPAKRVITVCYYALVNKEIFQLQPGPSVSEVKWFSIKSVPKMAFDHNKILKQCLIYLRHKVMHEPIGFNLLPKKFTLLQLQQLYEAILDEQLNKPNFRRKFMKMNLLVPCDEKQTDVSHRAAQLFRFDRKVYNRLIQQGFSFEV